MNIKHREGVEGPRDDPYGYDEYVINYRDKEIVIHQGIGDYVLLYDLRLGKTEEDISEILLEEIGLTLAQVKRAYYKRQRKLEKARLRCCEEPDHEWKGGYPGEEMLVCNNCHKVVDYSFNINAVI